VWPAADRKPRPLIATEANERNGQISPDGKWIAYSSTLTGASRAGASGDGRPEIFVQPFPVQGTARWQISPHSTADGGRWPRWNRKTNELLYRAPVNGPWFTTGWMFSVAWQAKGAAFTHEAPRMFLRINALNYPHSGGDYHTYAVSPDGQRFLIFQYLLTGGATPPSDADPAAGVTVLMHWTQTVRK
jgi:Tol biopolymer transport system component